MMDVQQVTVSLIMIQREQNTCGDWDIVAVIIDGEPATITDALRLMSTATTTRTLGVSTIVGTSARRVEYACER